MNHEQLLTKYTAVCKENQRLVDAVQDKLASLAQPRRGERDLKRALSWLRARKMLANEPNPVTDYKEAIKIKGIGPLIATYLFPRSREQDVNKNNEPKQQKGTKRRRTTSETPPVTSNAQALPPTARKSGRAGKKRTGAKMAARVVSTEKYQRAYDEAVAHAEDWRREGILSWKLVLLIDDREGLKDRSTRDKMEADFTMSRIPYDVRRMPLGDYAWVLQGRTTDMSPTDPTLVELMAGTLIERKTATDLISSIHGQRYMAQGMRMSDSGLPQCILLLEGDIRRQYSVDNEKSQTALWETCLHKGQAVVETVNLFSTIQLVKQMHRRILQRLFPHVYFKGGEPVPVFDELTTLEAGARRNAAATSLDSMDQYVTYAEPLLPLGMQRFITYNELSTKCAMDDAKKKTIGHYHRSLLKQVYSIKGLKVDAIAAVYSTNASLMAAYHELENNGDRAKLLSELETRDSCMATRKSTVGPSSSKKVCMAYGCYKDDDKIIDVDQCESCKVATRAASSLVPSEGGVTGEARAVDNRGRLHARAPVSIRAPVVSPDSNSPFTNMDRKESSGGTRCQATLTAGRRLVARRGPTKKRRLARVIDDGHGGRLFEYLSASDSENETTDSELPGDDQHDARSASSNDERKPAARDFRIAANLASKDESGDEDDSWLHRSPNQATNEAKTETAAARRLFGSATADAVAYDTDDTNELVAILKGEKSRPSDPAPKAPPPDIDVIVID